MTSKRTEELLRWDRDHIMHSRWAIGGNIGFIIDKSHGIYLQDTEGKESVENFGEVFTC